MIKIKTYPKRIYDYNVTNQKHGPNDSFISIGYTFPLNDADYGQDLPVIPKSGRYILLNFDDVLEDVELPTLGGGENVKCHKITSEQASGIVKFALATPDDTIIHIHCQAGQSRSVGVGEALFQIFKTAGREVDLTHTKVVISPNQTVFKSVLDAYEAQL